MADTAIAITAGTGTNVDTRTEATNGNHRQVIVIGDPATNAGVAPVDATKGLAVDLTASGALPTVTAVTTVSTVTNLAQMGGAALNMGSGAISTGTQRVALATDSPGIIATAALTAATAPSVGIATLGQYNATNPAPTDTQSVALQMDPNGKLLVAPYGNPANFVSGAITSAMTGTTSTSLIAAPASGLRNYITQITVSNSHATVGTDVVIQDGSGGTTLYTIPAAPAYGGAVLTFPTPLRQPTTATAIFCANVTTGSSIKVSASGYKGV